MWGAHITLPDDADRRRHAHRRTIDLTEQSEDAPAAARQDPRLRLQGQRLDERRPGHRGGRAAGLQGRAGGADPQRGHGRLQQQPAVRRRSACTDGRRLRRRSTTSARRRTSSTCTRRTGRATATRTASGTRPPRSTAACSCRPASRRAATAPARPASSCGSRRPTAPPTGSASSAHRRPFANAGTGEITGHGPQLAGLAAVRRAHPRRAGARTRSSR